MIAIVSLHLYPVKSCGGIALDSVRLDATGFRWDRRWMVVDAATDVSLTQREEPRLTLVRTSLANEGVIVSAKGRPTLFLSPRTDGPRLTVSLFGETVEALTGLDVADAWFTAYLGRTVRLVEFAPDVMRLGGVQYPVRDPGGTTFVDNYGFLLVSENSLTDLQDRIDQPIFMDRFRPNIVLSGVDAYEEEYISTLSGNQITLRMTHPCYRCEMTTIDQATAETGPEPLATLMSYRSVSGSGVKFGAYATLDFGIGATMSRGDMLDAEWSF